MMYAQDYDETFPRFDIRPWGNSARLWGHYDQLGPYTMNEQVFICPSSHYTTTSHRTDLPAGQGFYRRTMASSYSCVRSYSGYGTDLTPMGGSNRRAATMAEVPRPAETILLFEARGHEPAHPDQFGFDRSTYEPIGEMADHGRVGVLMYRHAGQMNILYCDGHVQSSPRIMDWSKFAIQ